PLPNVVSSDNNSEIWETHAELNEDSWVLNIEIVHTRLARGAHFLFDPHPECFTLHVAVFQPGSSNCLNQLVRQVLLGMLQAGFYLARCFDRTRLRLRGHARFFLTSDPLSLGSA